MYKQASLSAHIYVYKTKHNGGNIVTNNVFGIQVEDFFGPMYCV